jgi:voltage-gated potassium channel
MSARRTGWEWFIQGTILVSLILHLIDLHLIQSPLHADLVPWFQWADLLIVGIFTLEYFIRWYHAADRVRYPFTLLAIIDLLAILPFYISHLFDLRSLRLVRMFRMLQLLKIYRYNRAMQGFVATIRKVLPQLEVVGLIVLIVTVISSTAMYECEHDAQPQRFRDLPDAIWWCVVTLTTVGYGDLYPMTDAWRWVAGVTVVIGLGIFGTFISLIGSAFLAVVQEEEQHTLHLSKPVYRQLKAWQRERQEPVDGEHLRSVADFAVSEFVARQKQLEPRVE